MIQEGGRRFAKVSRDIFPNFLSPIFCILSSFERFNGNNFWKNLNVTSHGGGGWGVGGGGWGWGAGGFGPMSQNDTGGRGGQKTVKKVSRIF